MKPNIRLPLIKFPNDLQLTLFLIKEELKSRRLFHALNQVGLDDCYFQPHLDAIILQHVSLDDGSDATFSIYDEIMEKRSHKIEADNDSIMKQALKAYHELVDVKKRIKSQELEKD